MIRELHGSSKAWFCMHQVVKESNNILKLQSVRMALKYLEQDGILTRTSYRLCRCTGWSHYMYKYIEPTQEPVEPKEKAKVIRTRTSPIERALSEALDLVLELSDTIKTLKERGYTPKQINHMVGLALTRGLK